MSVGSVLVPTTAMAVAPTEEEAQERAPEPDGQAGAEEQRRKILKTPLTDLDLSARTRRALKKARISVMWQLVSRTREELAGELNFRKKSLSELEELVAEKGLSFGMDVSKYNLDED